MSAPAGVVALLFGAAYAVLLPTLLVVGVLLTRPVVIADWTVSTDRRVAAWLANSRTDLLDGIARGVSWLTSTPAVIGLGVGAGLALAAHRRWPQFAVLVSGMTLELAVYGSVTYAVARPRPDVALGELPVTGSFPSGHAAMSVVLWGGLAVAVRSSTSDRRVHTGAAVGAAAVAVVVGVSRLYLGLHYLSDVIFGWLLGAAVLAVALVIGRLVALASNDEWPAAEQPASRRRRIARAMTVAVTPPVMLLVWGFAIEPRFILAVEELDADVPALSEEWRGKRVAVIGDLQVGIWLDNVGMAHEAVDRIVEAQPDMALLLGDFVYGEDKVEQNVNTAVDIVAPMPAAGIPTFAVLGNHDYEAGASALLVERLRAHDITVLRNEAVPLNGSGDGPPLWIVGIGAERPGEAAPERALEDVPTGAARIVMMHNPATFSELGAGTAPFAVAGHTHGGQIRVPFLPEWSYLNLVRSDDVHTDGWIDGYGAAGNELFVNRGIGMSLLPIRINCSPAVSVFELRPGETG